ncbi:MAG: class I SAM-dependent methyltransferase [Fimbriimonadaceae bacterium]|nr:class I SAM-dependent methyltransferase [Fimbriimonadaceae bacterium]
MSAADGRLGGSFRDPCGFVFRRDGVLYRQVNEAYRDEYAALKEAGLLAEWEDLGLLVSAPETDLERQAEPGAVAVLLPKSIRFVSHPYEWSFGMLRDAALLTLDLQWRAIERGFVLKDASAYNVQFDEGRPVFIDTLSFERYVPGEPWIAYAQFCRHFLAPLALMAHVDVRLGALMGEHLDGIPLDLAARLLPWRTKWSFGLLTHLHAHARAGASRGDGPSARTPSLSEGGMRGLIQSLRRTVESLRWEPKGTEWADYYSDTNYTEAGQRSKEDTVRRWLAELATEGATCWDLGANNGRYSRLAAEVGLWTLAADVDPAAVEQAYRHVRATNATNLHPLLVDLRNPPPGRGWEGRERDRFFDRGPADVALALALVHHLAIGNNVPLPSVWSAFARCGRTLIVEWVPKSDSQVQRMMRARRDVFATYDEAHFEASIPPGLRIVARAPIADSGRVLYRVAPR